MNAEQRLRMSLAPCEPGPQPLAIVMARLAAAAPRATGSRRRGPLIIVSSLLAFAAAAGMLASHLSRPPAQLSAVLPAVAETVAVVPVEPLPVVDADAAAMPVSPAPVVAQVEAAAVVEPMQPVDSSFRVLLQPLQIQASDPAAESRVREYYSALLEGLRTVPGLVLVPEATGDATATPADFRITVSGGDGRNNEFLTGVAMWQVTVRTEVWRGNAYRQEGSAMGSGGSLGGGSGAAAAAARAVATLTGLFPSSPAIEELRARHRAELQTRSSSVAQNVSMPAQQGAGARMDAQVVSMILERIAITPAPGSRAALWLSLRGQKHPDLMPQLLKALREETAAAVRKEIITQLALDFAEDPAVRVALAPVAASEPQPLPRYVAMRALSGDATWRDYVQATIRDTSLSAEQRLEPLTWMISASRNHASVDASLSDVLPALLDDDARVLADLLVRQQKQSTDVLGGPGAGIMTRLSAMDHPAVPDLLVAYFDALPSEMALRLLAQRRGDQRVQTKLEAIATGDADPKLRQQATSLLRQAVPAPRFAAPAN